MKSLGLSNPTRTVRRLEEDEFTISKVIDDMGRSQDTYVITEAGLYNLILRSRKPEAKAFKRWITHEVLPAIRKTGSYSVEQTKKLEAANNYIAKLEKELEEQYVLSRNFDRMLDIFKRKIEETVSLQEEVDRLKAQQTRALPAPKLGTAEGTMSTVQAAKLLQTHYPFVNRDWVIFTLRNAGCICKSSCEPTANGIRWNIVTPKLDVYFKNGVKTIGRQYSHITGHGIDWLAKCAKYSIEKESM
ncbi:BRO family protein [Lancefieldella rimae]|uniref:BRO-N domain-containing protein n=1 Tax=Lancefieldella rimae TaxID=1383 RepID=UPI0037C06E92